MTKREFDKANKENFGGKMPGEICCQYRRALWREHPGTGAFYGYSHPRDRLAERAAWRRRNPGTPVLGLSSHFRAPTCWRLLGRLPHLPYTREELEVLARGPRVSSEK